MLCRVAEKRLEEGKEAKLDSTSLAVLVARVGATAFFQVITLFEAS